MLASRFRRGRPPLPDHANRGVGASQQGRGRFAPNDGFSNVEQSLAIGSTCASQWTFIDGNYQEYEADKKKRLGEEGAKPKRMRFKALK